ncbi:MAG: hypothetical protein Q9187_003246, partial [Circinaria calcarea]
MDRITQQNEQTSIQSSFTTALRHPHTRSSTDAPEVLPMEHSKDRRQGPLLLPGKEDKEAVNNVDEADMQVVPLECQGRQEPGLQVLMGGEEKELVLNQDLITGLQVEGDGRAANQAKTRSRSPRHIFVFFIIVVAIVIIVVVPTTIFKRSRGAGGPTSPPTNAPATMAPSTGLPSATGIFNPAISTTPQARALPGIDITGALRCVPYTISDIWRSSQVLRINDVFIGSSLTAISYKSPAGSEMVTHHLFYIDTFGKIQDMTLTISSDMSGPADSWMPGNLGSYKFKAPLVAGVGMSVIANNGEYFVESSYVPNLTIAGVVSLFVGGIDGLVHEYRYLAQNNTWTASFTFNDTNGYSGISAYAVGTGATLLMHNNSGVSAKWDTCSGPFSSPCPSPNGETPKRWYA